jgi:hypothetical protein
LAAADAHPWYFSHHLALEGVDQGVFADPGFPRDKDELALPPHGPPQVPA